MGSCDLWQVRVSQHSGRERVAPEGPWERLAPEGWRSSEAPSARAFGLFERPQSWPLRVPPLHTVSAVS